MTKSHTKNKSSKSFTTRTSSKKSSKTKTFDFGGYETHSMMHVGP